jgi:hypothetical protein
VADQKIGHPSLLLEDLARAFCEIGLKAKAFLRRPIVLD